MKKILVCVLTIFLCASSFLFVDTFSKFQEYFLVNQAKTQFSIKDSDANTLNNLIQISNKYNVTMQKLEYVPTKDSKILKTVVYAQIQNPNEYYENINIDNKKITKESSKQEFLSSQQTGKKEQIGTIKLIDKKMNVEIRPLSGAEKQNLNTDYFLFTDDEQKLNSIKTDLMSLGININFEKIQKGIGYLPINIDIILSIFIILIILVLTIICYLVLNFKELAIKKLNGYTNKRLIGEFNKSLLKYILIISLSIFILSIILFINSATLIFYVYFGAFLIVAILGLLLMNYIVSNFIYGIDIKLMIKNKKPLTQIHVINYLFKIVSTFVIISICFSTITTLKELNQKQQELSLWEDSKNYAYTVVTSFDADEKGMETEEFSKKIINFYKDIEKQGAMLIEAGNYYTTKFEYLNDPRYSFDMKILEQKTSVNKNYLKKYPVKDVNGNIINVDKFSDDKVYVLIPDSYLQNKELVEKIMLISSQNKELSDQNFELSQQNLPVIKGNTEFIYYKSGQKFFNYRLPRFGNDVMVNMEDPILSVVNNNYFMKEILFSLFTSGEILIPIKNPEDPYSEIYPILEKHGLEKNILGTPLVYSKVDDLMFYLKRSVATQTFILVALLISFIIVSVFMTLNYAQKNQLSNAIKRINGYSFIKRYYIYILSIIIPTILFGLIIGLKSKNIMQGLIIGLILAIIEFMILFNILKMWDLKNTKNILKGE